MCLELLIDLKVFVRCWPHASNNVVLQVKGVSVTGVTAPVSALDFCSETLFIAIGSDSGLVRP